MYHLKNLCVAFQRLPSFKNWRTCNIGMTEENKKMNRSSSVIPCKYLLQKHLNKYEYLQKLPVTGIFHMGGKPQKTLLKTFVNRELYPVILMKSWMEGKSADKERMDRQPWMHKFSIHRIVKQSQLKRLWEFTRCGLQLESKLYCVGLASKLVWPKLINGKSSQCQQMSWKPLWKATWVN